MKKIVLLLSLCWISIDGFSQVGINTTSPNAQLEIKSSNQVTPTNTDGILIPKIDAFPVTNPTAAQNSMMVYLTNDLLGKPKGFYYWDDNSTSWKGIGGAKGWDVVGNTGTNPATNFIGTTDYNDVVFKRNNIQSGLINEVNTSFGSGALNPASVGSWNTAIGEESMRLNTLGENNTALGAATLWSNNTGAWNTAVGANAMSENTSGSYNTAIGLAALQLNTFGENNVALGHEALQNNNTGDFNTSIGFQSGHLTKGSSNLTLGAYAAVPDLNGNNQLSIGNVIYGTTLSTTALGKIGIGEPAPAAKLQISSATPATPVNTDGIIIPRVSTLTATGSMTAAQNGMMVFLTTPANQAGFYYWDETTTSWKGVADKTGWSLNGNVGTNPATNFIGNTDDVSLNFRVNNITAGKIERLNRNSFYGYNAAGSLNATAVSNTAIGYEALRGSTTIANNTGSFNSCFGDWALYKNSTGSNNLAYGNISLAANTTGSGNLAFGNYAMSKIAEGSFGLTIGHFAMFYFSGPSGPFTNNNTAIGTGAMRGEHFGSLPGSNNTGLRNTVVGYNGLDGISSGNDNTISGFEGSLLNTTGNNNTGFGSQTLHNNVTGNSNVALGYQAGYNETGSNKLYIENSNSTTPLIYGEFDNDLIRINGITQGIYTQLTANGDGQSSIYGYRTRDSQNDGTSYSRVATNKAVSGYNYWGDQYTFGVTGYCYNDYTRTGGILGADTDGTYWSSLGYKNSASTTYGVYATAVLAIGAGRFSQPQTNTSIGGGFYGGIIGSWSKGNSIGQVSSGTLFASYNSGDEYTAGKQIEIVATGNTKTAAYTVTSSEITVYNKGTITLHNGTARVNFDADYSNLLGDIPVVTATPMGECNGLYIASVDKSGFTIKELNHGSSTTAVSWITVGNRIDALNSVSKAVLNPDFDNNINEVMFNENNKSEKAKAIWSESGNIHFGELPQQLIEKPTK